MGCKVFSCGMKYFEINIIFNYIVPNMGDRPQKSKTLAWAQANEAPHYAQAKRTGIFREFLFFFEFFGMSIWKIWRELFENSFGMIVYIFKSQLLSYILKVTWFFTFEKSDCIKTMTGVNSKHKNISSNFSCMFLNPNIFFQFDF